MRFGNLIFGVALLLVATTLALTITFRPAVPEQPSAGNDSDDSTVQRAPTPARNRPLVATPAPGKSVPRPPRRKIPEVEDLDLVLDDSPSAPQLSPAQRQAISSRTAGVKRAALARLDKMTKRLDLTAAQRHKIFPQVLRSTNGYHEAMVLSDPLGVPVPVGVASNTKSPDEAIHDALDPEQQDEYLEDQLDERAWWNEIVAQLEDDFDSAVAAGTAPPEDPAPEDPAAEENPAPGDSPSPQGGNIFDLLEKK